MEYVLVFIMYYGINPTHQKVETVHGLSQDECQVYGKEFKKQVEFHGGTAVFSCNKQWKEQKS